MEAVILAGGFGTRLRDVVPGLPKPMAPVHGRPFLAYLLDYLQDQGVARVILATGYKHDMISAYFGHSYRRLRIDYSREEEPLGTGGAAKKAFKLTSAHAVFLLNGDTYFRIDFPEMMRRHIHSGCPLTIAVKKAHQLNRYGTVRICGGRIAEFGEKNQEGTGWLNGGIYCIASDFFNSMELPEQFSFEYDILKKYCRNFHFTPFISDDYFIDIGVPEDYARAGREMILFA